MKYLAKLRLVIVVAALTVAASIAMFGNSATAATNNYINFQARLLNSTGSLALDGNYNISFHIFDVANGSSGSTDTACGTDTHCLWSETYTVAGANAVRVAGGYLSVQLGSSTALPTTLNWDQQLYLTMDVGGTASSPTWDGQMLSSGNRLPLTGVPYALRAGALAASSGSNITTLTLQAPSASGVTFIVPNTGTSASTQYNICTSASAATCTNFEAAAGTDFIRNQTSLQTANFNIQSAAAGSIGAVIRGNASQSVDILDVATSAANVLTVGSTGSATFQNAADTTVGSYSASGSYGFSVKNSLGTNLVATDTGNQITYFTNLQSTGTISLQNSQGASIQLRTASSSSTGLTASGGLITDSTGYTTSSDVSLARAAGLQGEAIQPPDSSTGFWEATTNLVTNGGFEANTTGWTGGTNGSIAKSTVRSKFGAASGIETFNGAGQAGADYPITLSTTTQYTISAWIYIDPAFSGATQLTLTTANFTGITNNNTANATVTVAGNTGKWIQLSRTVTTAADGTGDIQINGATGTPANGAIYYVDGVQVEQKAIVTPYVETSGATASRTEGKLTGPNTALTINQGWVAARVRMGFASTATLPATNAVILSFDDGTNNERIQLLWSSSGQNWQVRRCHTNVCDTSPQIADSFNQGDVRTIIMRWDTATNNKIYLSVNGASFGSGNAIGQTPTGINNLVIGTSGVGNNSFDGDIFWLATGTGLLTDNDASTLYKYGNNDPTLANLQSLNSSTASPTLVWDGSSANYTGNNASYTNQSQISIDDINLTHTGPGALALQGSVNSSTAFQVQDAAGAPIFVVDTTSTDGTGAQVNYLAYPGFESGSFSNASAGWNAVSPATLSQNTSKVHTYNGLYSAQVVTTAGNGGLTTSSFAAIPTTGTYIISFYAKVSSGTMDSAAFTVQTTDGATHTCSPVTGTSINSNGFQRVYCTITTTGTISAFQITQNDSTARTIYIDSVQLQKNTVNGNTITTPSAYQVGAIQLRGIITNPVAIQSSGNSTAAFQVLNASGMSVLDVDTLNNQITVGNSDIYQTIATPTLLGGADVAGTNTTAGLGTGVDNEAANDIVYYGKYIYLAKAGDNGTTCGTTVGAAAQACELQIYDATNPAAPVYMGGVDASGTLNGGSGNTAFNGLAINGHYLYVAKSANGTNCNTAGNHEGCELQVYDISNPINPTYVGGADSSGSTNAGASSNSFFGISISGNYVYVAQAGTTGTCSATAGNATGCELKTFNIANPANPAYVGGADESGTTNSGAIGATNFQKIRVYGRYAYIANAGSATDCDTAGNADGCELQIYDISNPGTPTFVSGVDAGGNNNGSSGTVSSSFNDIGLISGGRYLVVEKSGVSANACTNTAGTTPGATGCETQIYDLSNPASPIYIAGIDSTGAVGSGTGGAGGNNVTIAGKYAYISMAGSTGTCSNTVASGCELSIYDFSNPASPVYLTGMDATGVQTGLISLGDKQTVINGRYLYMARANSATDCATASNASGCELQTFDISGLDAVSVNAGSVYTGALTADQNAIFNQGVTVQGGINVGQNLQVNGDAGFGGSVLLQNDVNSTSAFQIQNSSAVQLFSADTTNLKLTANQSTFVVTGMSAPTGPATAVGANTGGSLLGSASTTYFYKITALNAAGESLASSEVSRAGSTFTALSVPSAPSGALATGSDLNVGNYLYELTVVTPEGESTVGAESTTVTTTSGNQDVTLTVPSVPTGATGFKVYRTLVNGASGSEALVTVGGCSGVITTTCTDNATDAQVTGAPPGANTARTDQNNITVTWTAVANATSYRVYRGTATGAESAYQTATGSPFTDTGAAGTAASTPTQSTIGQLGVGVAAPTANLDVLGTVHIESGLNSTTALQLQNASGVNVMSIDTVTSSIVQSDAVPTFVGGADSVGTNTAAGLGTGTGNDGVFNDVVYYGRYLYAAKVGNATACNSGAGNAIGCEIQIYDATNPASPTYVTGIDSSGTLNSGTLGTTAVNGLAISGHYLYAVKSGDATDCSTVGNHVGCELQVYDISNPVSPTYVGGADASGTANSGTTSLNFNGISISGNYAFIASSTNATACSATLATGCELKVFNISNPANPTYLGGADQTGTTNSGVGNTVSFSKVRVYGNYAYVVNTGSGTNCNTAGNSLGCELQVYNVSNPALPTFVSGVDAGGTNNGSSGTQSSPFNDVSVSGRYVYVVKGNSGTACTNTTGANVNGCEFQVYDFSNPASPTFLSGFDESGVSSGVGTGAQSVAENNITIAGRYVYISANGSNNTCSNTIATGCELQVYDISNPTSITYQTGIDSKGLQSGTGTIGDRQSVINGRYLYMVRTNSATDCATTNDASGCELQIYNVSGVDAVSINAGSTYTGALTADQNAIFNQNITVAGAATIGQNLQITGGLGVAGPVAFQNTTNSATALQIQNSGGTSFFTADSQNLQLNTGSLQSNGTISLQNGQGSSIQLKTTSATTVSAMSESNVIVDYSASNITNPISRAASLQGDGAQPPQASTGIWEGTTNIVTNGGFESNSTGWTTSGTNTIASSNANAKFGASSLKATYQNTAATLADYNITLTNAVYTYSAWIYIPASYTGTQVQLKEANFASSTGTASVNANMALRNQWQRVSASFTPAAGDLLGDIIVGDTGTPTAGNFIYIDGAQVEQKAYATPYVETNGGTAARSAASVAATSSTLSTTAGWVALRVRPGLASASTTSGVNYPAFSWNDGTSNNRIELVYSGTDKAWETRRVLGGAGGSSANIADTFSAGTARTIVMYWNSTTVGISVNGSAFTTAANGNLPTGLAATFNIGGIAANGFLDGDVVWTGAGTLISTSGSLTTADATSLYNYGNSTPTLSNFAAVDTTNELATFAWDAQSTQYSGTNGSLTNQAQISIDDVSLTHLGNGALALQGSANSTTAFQVQNASANGVLTVDTSNSIVALGTPSALTGSLKLYNAGAAGSVSLQSNSQGSNNFTISVLALSGNANLCTSDAICGLGTGGTDNYLIQVPSSNSANAPGANVISPTAASIVGLTVNGTTNATSADVVDVVSGVPNGQTSSNGISFNQNSAGTTTSGIQIQRTSGTLTNGLVFSGTIGTDIVGNAKALNITAAGTSTWQTTSGNLTVQATAASSQVALDSGSSGTVNLGNTNATTIAIGGATNSTTTIGGGNGTGVTQTVSIAGGTSTTSGGKVVNIATGTPGSSTTNTIHIGDGGTTTGTVAVTIGSNGQAGHQTTIKGGNGAGAITLSANGNGNTGTIVTTVNNSTLAFQIQNASSLSLFSVDSTNQKISINQSQAYVIGNTLAAAPGIAAGSNQGGTLSGAPGTTYYYRVSAITPNGESPSAEASFNGYSFTPLTPPGAPTVGSPSAGGSVTLGTHSYEVTFVTANGETIGGTASSVVNVTTGGTQTVPISVVPTGPTGTTSRKIYRTVSGNAGSYLLVTTIAGNSAASYNDTTADGSLGAAAPTANTATTNTNNATITFSSVSGATSYRVYRSTTTQVGYAYQTTASSPFTDTGTTGTTGNPPAASTTARLGVGTTSPTQTLSVAGDALFQNAVNSTTSFQIQNSSSTSLLTADTVNSQIIVSGGQVHTFSIDWGGSGTETINSTVQTSDGGYAVTGYTSSFGAGSNDVFIAKYSSTGALVWNKVWGGTGDDQGNSIVQTSDGGYAVAGYTASFGSGNGDVFIAKYDSSGNLTANAVWGNSAGADVGISLVQTSDSGYAVTGQTILGAGNGDLFLLKYDKSLNVVFNKTWGSAAGIEYGLGIVQTSDGGYAVTGYTTGFGAGGEDVVLLKYDSSGNLTWNKVWGGSGDERGQSLVQTSDGGYAVTEYTPSFGAGSNDVFLLKYDSSGNLTWNKVWGGAGSDRGFSVVQTADGGYAVGGRTASFGAGNIDAALLKYDSSGNLTWNRTWGGASGNEQINSIVQTSDGGYAAGGSEASFGAGGADGFLNKYDANGNIAGCVSPICQSPSATTSAPSATTSSPSATVGSPSATVSSPSATTSAPSATTTTNTSNVYNSALSISGDVNLAGSFTAQGGTALFQSSINSNGAFRIQNQAGSNLFVADTINNQLVVTNTNPNANATISVSATSNLNGVNATATVGDNKDAIALGGDGFPRIAYIDQRNSQLKFIQCSNAACTSNTTTVLDSSVLGNIALVSRSIAIKIASDGFARIAYNDNNGNHLKYIQCKNASCSSDTLTTINADVSGAAVDMDLGTDGFARIVYKSASTGFITLVQCGNIDCSTVTATTSVDTTIAGFVPSITMLASDGFPRITYQDNNVHLKFADCTNASCSTKTLTVVDSAVAGLANASAVTIASVDGFARIVEDDSVNTDIKYVQCTNLACSTHNIVANTSMPGDAYRLNIAIASDNFARIGAEEVSGGNTDNVYFVQCTTATCVNASNVNTLVDTNSYITAEMVVDSSGFGHFVYGAGNTAGRSTASLKLAQCTNATCSTNTQSIVTAPQNTNVGQYTSMALGSDGYARISYYDSSNKSVDFTRCLNSGCTSSTAVTIDASNTDIGKYTSIAIGADGLPRIAYYDSTGGFLLLASCANADCTKVTVNTMDSTANVGSYVSLAAGKDGSLDMAYYDTTNGHLKLRNCSDETNVPSSCTQTTIDSSTSVGTYTSMALDSNNLEQIAYYDATNGHLKFMQCTNASCSTKNINTVDSGTSVGTYTSIAMGLDGLPRISYYDATNHALKFAQCTNAACSTSNISTVDNSADVGQYSSVSIAPDSFARISYYDNTNHRLKFAICTNAACSTSLISVADSSSANTGQYTSIEIGSDGLARISYYDVTNGLLRYYVQTGTGATATGINLGTASTALFANLNSGNIQSAYALIKPPSDVTTAFQVQDSAGTTLIQVDTSSNIVYLGASGSNTTTTTVDIAVSDSGTQTVNIGNSNNANTTINLSTGGAINLNGNVKITGTATLNGLGLVTGATSTSGYHIESGSGTCTDSGTGGSGSATFVTPYASAPIPVMAPGGGSNMSWHVGSSKTGINWSCSGSGTATIDWVTFGL